MNTKLIELLKRFLEKERKSKPELIKIGGKWYLERKTRSLVGNLSEEEVEQLKRLIDAYPAYDS